MRNLHPTFEAILKPHLQGQTVVARKRDTIRYNALHKGWDYLTREFGELAPSFGTFVKAVDIYEAAREEAHLDAQYEYEQLRKAKEQFEAEDAEAEREERRLYRAWRNDSGV